MRALMPRLRSWRDLQSLAYMAALPLLVWWQWRHGWNPWLYTLELFLTLGIGVIHHNHTHLRMWQGRWANRFTDYLLTLLQGHPTFVFWPAHVANHHRHRHGLGGRADRLGRAPAPVAAGTAAPRAAARSAIGCASAAGGLAGLGCRRPGRYTENSSRIGIQGFSGKRWMLLKP